MATLTLQCPNNMEGACWGWLPYHTYDFNGYITVTNVALNLQLSSPDYNVSYLYEVRLSMDSVTWTTVHSFTTVNVIGPYSIGFDVASINARYLRIIKITANDGGFIDSSSGTVTYSGIAPPPPTCENGALRAPYWCINGTTEIMREVCQNNEWVDSGQVCPKICNVGDSYCEIDNTLQVCVAHDQYDNWWEATGQACECSQDGCMAGVECEYGPYQSCCTMECKGGQLISHECAECYACANGMVRGEAVCPDGTTIYEQICVDHNWVDTGSDCETPPAPPIDMTLLVIGGAAIAAVAAFALMKK